MVILVSEFDKIEEFKYKFLYNFLPKSRRIKVDKLKNLIDKKIAIIEYFIVKHFLKIKGNPDFKYTEKGKPFYNNKHFNISHCDNILVIAISEQEVGVDIQRLIEYDEKLIKHICNRNEINQLDKNAKSLTRLWTQKESLIKCMGGTIVCDLKNVLNNSEGFEFSFYERDDYIISLCKKL